MVMRKLNRFAVLLAALVLGIGLNSDVSSGVSVAHADSSFKVYSLTLQIPSESPPAPSPTPIVSQTPQPSATSSPTPVSSPTPPPPPQPRLKTSQAEVDGHLWWLVEWRSNKHVCDLSIDHEGNPIGTDILYGCGQAVYDKWAATKGCVTAPSGNNQSLCHGLYLFYIKPVKIARETTVEIPPPSARVSLSSDCSPAGITYHCTGDPSLVITGIEPMEGQSILSIEGDLDGVHFLCEINPCNVLLKETDLSGIHANYWVNSSYGDSSELYSASLRMLPLLGDTNTPVETPKNWQVDVVTAQWDGAPLVACSQSWESLPDAKGLPDWLGTPSQIELMASNNKYYYLAAELIRAGLVNVEGCANYGLESSFAANTCGLQKSDQLVVSWQNQFDNVILSVAQTENMSATMMKNIIGRESQFWPGVYSGMSEVGLGQMTEGGADTLLMWNEVFYNQYCNALLGEGQCAKGYNNLPEYERGYLKGALLSNLNTFCSDCISKVNLDQTNFSVEVLSSTLLASCEQTGQVVYNLTGKAAGSSASYDDLWKLTLVNYNAGVGCLNESIKKTIAENLPLNWENISTRLDKGCQGAIDYVNDITKTFASGGGGSIPSTPATEPATSSN
jgi:hypothetical protein